MLKFITGKQKTMPVIENSTYKAPLFLGNNHLQTVFPTLFRRVDGVSYNRERITTADSDFIDIDISSVGAERAVILSHGLEGSSDRHYMRGMTKAFNSRGWDSVAFNFRGCSGEMNRVAAMYHSGKTEDLHTVIEHVLNTRRYKSLTIAGFSLGGNLTLKYAGERGNSILPQIKCAIGISAPCDLVSSTAEIEKMKNIIYAKRFLSSLVKKVKEKEHLLPPGISRDYETVKTIRIFDDRYTAPLHGFVDAMDYYRKCSSRRFIAQTAIPTLILNAKDDPILGPDCFPYEEAMNSSKLFLEVPERGGHMGFITFSRDREYWHETRAVQFADSHI